MAFANAGASAGLLAVATYVPNPGATGAQYVANDLEFTSAGGAHVSGAPEALSTVVVAIASPLTNWQDATITGAATDTGILTTAAAGTDEHGLPANFGPGRGNWTDSDLARLSIEVFTDEPIPALSQPSIAIVSLDTAGDLRVVFKNGATTSPDDVTIKLRYDHSQVF